MVKGLEKFREYFAEYTNQYVLIGGAACDILFSQNELDFRATRDLDIVLIVEAQTKEFGERFWQFIEAGRYVNKVKSNGNPQFYRFERPQEPDFPSMIELFARAKWILAEEAALTPVHIDDSVSSLSAILLDDAYYEMLLEGRDVFKGISFLQPEWLIPFKAKAWMDLCKKKEEGQQIDSKDIKKHRNDILRLVAELALNHCQLPEAVEKDMKDFLEKFHVTDVELKNLRVMGVHEEDIKNVLRRTYFL